MINGIERDMNWSIPRYRLDGLYDRLGSEIPSSQGTHALNAEAIRFFSLYGVVLLRVGCKYIRSVYVGELDQLGPVKNMLYYENIIPNHLYHILFKVLSSFKHDDNPTSVY